MIETKHYSKIIIFALCLVRTTVFYQLKSKFAVPSWLWPNSPNVEILKASLANSYTRFAKSAGFCNAKPDRTNAVSNKINANSSLKLVASFLIRRISSVQRKIK